MAGQAFAQFQISESFTTNVANSNIVRGGAAVRTAGTIDPQGEGWLRLTDDLKNQVGYCYINESFPSDLGATIEFEFLAYTNQLPEADGFSIFLFDGSYGPGTFAIGEDGGALGYGEVDAATHPTGWTLGPGVTGGYIGVGLDVFGNYSVKQTKNDSKAPGFRAQAIAVRGPSSTHTTYLDGTRANLGGTVYAGQKLSYGSAISTRPNMDNYYRKVKLLLLKEGANYTITVFMQVSKTGTMQQVFGPTPLPFAPPPTLKIGFAASTGLYFDIHEVRNLFATTPGGVHTRKNGPLSVTNGDAMTYDVDVYNDATNFLHAVPLTDTLPPAFQYSSMSFLNNGYTSNTYDNAGHLNGRVFSGGKLELSVGSRSTVQFHGTAHFTDSAATILRNIAYAKVAPGFADPDVANDTAVFYSYRAPAIHPFTTLTLCDSGNISIPVTTMNNAKISWTASSTGSVSGAVSGSATANANGVYTFAPALHNNGTAPATVTYTFTPSYTYTSPADGSAVEITGQPQVLNIILNPRPVVTPVQDVSVCSLTPIPQINFTSNISGATFAWTNSIPQIGIGAAGTGPYIPSTIAANVTPTTRVSDLTVTATANACPSLPDTFHITVNTLTIPGFTINNPSQCANDNSFTFTNTTNPAAAVNEWDFGDGQASTAVSPTHTYQDPGTYNVRLIARNAAGCEDTLIRQVTLYPTPDPTFTTAITSLNKNNEFQFTPGTGNPSVTIVSYHWDFGDGSSSTQQSPTHTYAQDGNYKVTLTVTSDHGCVAQSSTTVTVSTSPNVQAGFTINNGSQCLTGNSFVFTNTTILTNGSTVVSQRWDFGDGSQGSMDVSPTYVYRGAGQYIVTLTVTTNTGFQDVATQTVVVKPVPDVHAVPDTTVCEGAQVGSIVFTGDLPGTNYHWSQTNALIGITADDGNGNLPPFTATLPDHRDNFSTFTVTPSLNGCTGTPTQFTITVAPAPVINTVQDQTLCAGATTQAVTFTSSVQAAHYTWTNDNPAIGLPASGTGNLPAFATVNNTAVPQVAHITVTTTATECPDAASTSTSFTITVNPLPHLMSGSIADICDNSTFSFSPASTVTGTTFAWSRPVTPGIDAPAGTGTGGINETLHNTTDSTVAVTYQYTLTTNGCTTTAPVTVRVKPTPVITSSSSLPDVCSGNPVNYVPLSNTAQTIFHWARPAVPGIAEPAATGVGGINEVLTATQPQPARVTYYYTADAQGCTAQFTVAATINPEPTLSSTPTPGPVCSGTPFSYAPAAALDDVSFAWTRLSTPGISNPAAAGSGAIHETLVNATAAPVQVTYRYVLGAKGCVHTEPVTLTVNPVAGADFTINDTVQCLTGNSFVFTRVADANVDDNAWHWTLDDGTVGNGATVIHSYTSAGTYNVVLQAANTFGCGITATKPVRVAPMPHAAFTYTVTSGATSDTYQFTSHSVVIGGTITAYAWDFGDGTTSTAASPAHTYTVNGTYTVSQTVTTADGCMHTATAQIVVHKNPDINAGFTVNDADQCLAGNSFAFTNTSTVAAGGTITGYQWDFGDGSPVSTLASPTHVYTPPGTYTVTLTVTATLAGSTFTGTVSQQVIVTPTPVMASLSDITVCANTTVGSIHFQSAGTDVTYNWTNDNPSIGLAASGSGNSIDNFTAANTTGAAQVAHIMVTPSADGCTGTAQSFAITVNPQPEITATPDAAFCPEQDISVTFQANTSGTTFSWTNDNTATGLPASGGNTLSFQTENNTANALVSQVVVSATAAGCSAVNDTFDITVNPGPQLLNPPIPVGVCDGDTLDYVALTNTGTVANWRRDAVPGISNPAATGVDSVHEALHNTTNAAVAVQYSYTLVSDKGCVSGTAAVVVTVNPIPRLQGNFTPPAICDGTVFHYTPASNVSGAAFLWERSAVPGISNPAALGTGDPAEVLDNTTDVTVNAVYNFAVEAGGCASTQHVTVPVNPTPRLSSDTLLPAICSGATFTYQPKSNTPNVTYTWSRAAVTGIAEAASTGSGSITEMLTNTTTAVVQVAYVYTITYDTCTSTATVTVPVNPAAAITGTFPNLAYCAGDAVPAIAMPVNIPGAVVYWVNDNPNIGLPAEGVGTIPTFTAANSTGGPIVANIRAYAQSPTGCRSSTPIAFTITVNPHPGAVILAPLGTTLCEGNSLPLVATGGDTYTWYRDGVVIPAVAGGVLNVTGGGAYTVTVSTTEGCSDGPSQATVVTEVRKPVADFTFLGSCVNTTIAFTNQSTTTGSGTVTYSWMDDAGHTATLLAPTFIYTAGGTYHMQLKATPALCPFLADSITKPVIIEAPVATIAAAQGTVLCEGSTLQLVASGGDTYTWYGDGMAIAGQTGNTLAVTSGGSYAVVAHTSNGCSSDPSAPVAVTAISKPVAAFSVGSGCADAPIAFTNQSIVTGSGTVAYAWKDDAGHTSTALSPSFTYASGNYNMQLTVTPALCPALATTTGQAFPVGTPVPGVTLPEVNTVANSGVTLDARSIPGASYEWTPATGLSSTTVQHPQASLTADQTYHIYMVQPSGCNTTDTLLVRVRGNDHVFIPNVITPNGDGANDKFVIVGIEKYPGSGLRIFNRWGNLVYRSDNYDNTWDGNGLNPGTYYYDLKLNTGNGYVVYKGWIQLIRN